MIISTLIVLFIIKVSKKAIFSTPTPDKFHHLYRESLRYQAAALRLMKMVGESVENFGEPDDVSRTVQEIACADRDRDKDKVFPDIKV